MSQARKHRALSEHLARRHENEARRFAWALGPDNWTGNDYPPGEEAA
jgi:hypothetical protein